MNWEAIIPKLQELAAQYGLNLVWAIVILIVGRIVAKVVKGVIAKVMGKAKVDVTLIKFCSHMVYILFMAFVIVAALEKLGVKTTSFVAILGAAGLAVGLALQGSLSNFAAGVLMIIFRPFKVGDFIEGGGVNGVVEEIQLFTTQLKTGDNKKVIVPNGAMTSGTITNFSAKDTRRVDMVIGVGYGDDLKKVRTVLEDILGKDERVLKDPGITIGVCELGDNSVNFAVRPWVKSADYWGVLFDTLETVKVRFDAEGLSIPYPQRDIHIHQAEAAAQAA